MWPWIQRQGRTCLKPIYSSYCELRCHLLSESVHIWHMIVVICWVRADLLAPLFVIYSCVFVTFSYHVLGSGVVLDCIDSWSSPIFFTLLKDKMHFHLWGLNPQPLYLNSQLKHSTTECCTTIVCGDHNENFRLLLWPWSKRSRSNISYIFWRELIFHIS